MACMQCIEWLSYAAQSRRSSPGKVERHWVEPARCADDDKAGGLFGNGRWTGTGQAPQSDEKKEKQSILLQGDRSPSQSLGLGRGLNSKLDYFACRGASRGIKEFYEFDRVLGEGAQGFVQRWREGSSPKTGERAHRRGHEHYVAIKLVTWASLSEATEQPACSCFASAMNWRGNLSKAKVENVERELEALLTLNHPYIVRGREWFEDPFAGIYFVMDYVPGVTLQQKLDDLCGQTDAEREGSRDSFRRLFRQIVYAIAHMHAHGMIHRDLKPENCMVYSEGHAPDRHLEVIKLIDFGFAIKDCKIKRMVSGLQHGEQALASPPGTLDFMCPELFINAIDQYESKPQHDIWALGVILVNILCGLRHRQLRHPCLDPAEGLCPLPVGAGSFTTLWRAYTRMHKEGAMWRRDFFDEDVDADRVKALGDAMLTLEPEARITAADLMRHEWMQDIDKLFGNDSVVYEHGASVLDSIRTYTQLSGFDHIVLHAIARHAPPSAVMTITRIFRILDTRENGMLSLEELVDGLRQYVGLSPSDEESIRGLFECLDLDGTGFIEYSEWLAATVGEDLLSDPDVTFKAFKSLDLQNTGVISEHDMKVAFPDEYEAVLFMEEFPDGIDYEQFETMVLEITARRLGILVDQHIEIPNFSSFDNISKNVQDAIRRLSSRDSIRRFSSRDSVERSPQARYDPFHDKSPVSTDHRTSRFAGA